MTNVKGPLLLLARKGSLAGNVSTLFEILPVFFQYLEHNEEEIRQWTTNGGWEQIYIKCNYGGEGSGIRPGTPM